MKTFICRATVKSIYSLDGLFDVTQNLVREYKAHSLGEAMTGFYEYLEHNKNLTSFSNVTVIEL